MHATRLSLDTRRTDDASPEPTEPCWQLKIRDPERYRTLADDFASSEGWVPARVPGTVHQDLMAAGAIPDPFFGRNELLVQGLGARDFLYRCSFTLAEGDVALTAPRVDLVCDGLDTFATLWLNEQALERPLARSDNMFIPLRVPVQGLLRPGHNELRILFEAAFPKGQAREADHGRRAVWNGDPSRVYVRKAQYHYGWDWGPCLLTAGPWLSVGLDVYHGARIAAVAAPARLSADLRGAVLAVHVAVDAAPSADPLSLELSLRDPDDAVVYTRRCPLEAGGADRAPGRELRATLDIDAPRLWWPAGQGPQERYTLQVTLLAGDGEAPDHGARSDVAAGRGARSAAVAGRGARSDVVAGRGARSAAVIDQRSLRLGLRRVRLLQEPLDERSGGGTGFTLEINGRPLFCGGANWIPADSFLPRVTRERYRHLLQAARDANMNMVRVWGGGVYEADEFYDLCDELGLMVWQDFMFACGIYPAEDWFQASVRAEAEAALLRLRHHPSIVLWCGNNEDYALARSLGLYPGKDGALDGRGPQARDPFPARVIYERLLADVCAALDPERPYWPGSPYGGDDPNAPGEGDRHTWDVWHGAMADYQHYPRYAGRFVSEFGMQAHPALATLAAYLPPEDLAPESAGLLHHNKADHGPARLHYYMHSNLPVPEDLPGQIYASQLTQAEALDHAYRGFRRRFGGPGQRAISGALVWQLNDCWPVTSWAIIDYALRRKGAYFAVRRALAPLSVGLAGTAARCEIWVANGTPQAAQGELRLFVHPLRGGDDVAPAPVLIRPVQLLANQALEVGALALSEEREVVCAAQLLVAGRVVARATLWPQPLCDLPAPGVAVQADGARLLLSARRPAKGVWLAAGDATFSDNMIDLLPGDEQLVEASGLALGALTVRWAGDHLHEKHAAVRS